MFCGYIFKSLTFSMPILSKFPLLALRDQLVVSFSHSFFPVSLFFFSLSLSLYVLCLCLCLSLSLSLSIYIYIYLSIYLSFSFPLSLLGHPSTSLRLSPLSLSLHASVSFCFCSGLHADTLIPKPDLKLRFKMLPQSPNCRDESQYPNPNLTFFFKKNILELNLIPCF